MFLAQGRKGSSKGWENQLSKNADSAGDGLTPQGGSGAQTVPLSQLSLKAEASLLCSVPTSHEVGYIPSLVDSSYLVKGNFPQKETAVSCYSQHPQSWGMED
jgi:hypothetical protein